MRSLIDTKDKVVIKEINCDFELFRKLASMGIAPTRKIKVITRVKSGPLIVGFENSILAISKEIALKIMVGD